MLLLLVTLFERVSYKRPFDAQEARGPGWQRTTERFVDEETGAMVTVYVQPETGERAYA